MSILTIQLPDEIQEIMEEEAAKEGFADPSGYIQALFMERQLRKRKGEIEAKLLEALDAHERGESVEMTAEDWQRIRREFRQRHGIPELP